ncbi:MAG: ISAs1 family transposase [Acidimicrobiia bacterium]|nr:ISAs1 family transposase [Acidimicrobiia bacterium]
MRVKDLQLENVGDPRVARKVTYQLPAVLTAFIAGLVTNARSLRQVEQRTGQMAKKNDRWLGLDQRIADNTFGKLLPRLSLSDLLSGLHNEVKAEHRRGNLTPTVLPVGTIAIDGKNVATLRWHDLCRVLELEQNEAEPDEVKALLAQRFPLVQFVVPKQGRPYALARVHTVTLTSADAAVCIHQRPIIGHTNEIGSMPELLDELHAAYGRSSIVTMVTTDSGNTSLEVAKLTLEQHWDYFLQIKSGHGDLYTEAERALGSKTETEADFTDVDQQKGEIVTYHLWQHDLSDQGWLDWTHARQLVRIQRTTENLNTGQVSVGNRFYVCNKPPTELRAKACSKISRAHWRCENETHWTADAEIREDKRRLAWSRHPHGVFVVSLLRRMAVNILAVVRRMSRVGYSQETPSWRQVTDHFLLVLCDSILETEAFDAAE